MLNIFGFNISVSHKCVGGGVPECVEFTLYLSLLWPTATHMCPLEILQFFLFFFFNKTTKIGRKIVVYLKCVLTLAVEARSLNTHEHECDGNFGLSDFSLIFLCGRMIDYIMHLFNGGRIWCATWVCFSFFLPSPKIKAGLKMCVCTHTATLGY